MGCRIRIGRPTEIDLIEGFEVAYTIARIATYETAVGVLSMVIIALFFATSQRRALANAEQLENALTKVLTGYLPICASCKKIRDRHGEWQPVERYVAERTDAAFTHGMCPECGETWFGEDWDADGPTETHS